MRELQRFWRRCFRARCGSCSDFGIGTSEHGVRVAAILTLVLQSTVCELQRFWHRYFRARYENCCDFETGASEHGVGVAAYVNTYNLSHYTFNDGETMML